MSELLSATARHAAELRAAGVPVYPDDSVPIRAWLTTHPFDAPIPFEILARTGDSSVTQPGVPRGVRRTGRFKTQLMPVFDRFEPTLVVPPAAYLVPADPAVIENLRLHGVNTEAVQLQFPIHAQTFTIDSIVHAVRPFQGHRETRVTGRWRDTTVTAVQGMLQVVGYPKMHSVAAYLLEPESDDGLLDWNFFDRQLAVGRPYPVLRVLSIKSDSAHIIINAP